MSKTMQATVKVMLSYDYCHFEISKTIESYEDGGHLTQEEVDMVRKDCQRLADKAVGQYKKAKSEATKVTNNSYERMQLEKEVREIKSNKNEENWTPLEKAKVKAMEDYNHQEKYNYMDDEDYQIN